MGNNLAEIIGIVLGLTAIGGVIAYNKHKTTTDKPKETQAEKTRKILASMGEIFGGKTKKNKKHKK
jgi:hypothetical protein